MSGTSRWTPRTKALSRMLRRISEPAVLQYFRAILQNPGYVTNCSTSRMLIERLRYASLHIGSHSRKHRDSIRLQPGAVDECGSGQAACDRIEPPTRRHVANALHRELIEDGCPARANILRQFASDAQEVQDGSARAVNGSDPGCVWLDRTQLLR